MKIKCFTIDYMNKKQMTQDFKLKWNDEDDELAINEDDDSDEQDECDKLFDLDNDRVIELDKTHTDYYYGNDDGKIIIGSNNPIVLEKIKNLYPECKTFRDIDTESFPWDHRP